MFKITGGGREDKFKDRRRFWILEKEERKRIYEEEVELGERSL